MNMLPPKSVQHRFILKLQTDINQTNDLWEYALSTIWVTSVQQFIQDEKSTAEVPPLYASDWDQENVYVGENSWKVLASWYGLDRQYSCRRRSTLSSYVDIFGSLSLGVGAHRDGSVYVLADNKLDFLTLFCSHLKELSSDQAKHKYIMVYFWDSIDFVEFQLRCALKVHPRKNVRLWMSFSDDGADVVLENITTFRNTQTPIGSIICKNCPEVLEMLQKRQSLPANNHSERKAAASVPTKGELWDVFLSEHWHVTLCLEELPDTIGTQPDAVIKQTIHLTVPPVFCNLPIDHMFQKDTEEKALDEKVKQVLDESSQEFNKLIKEQRRKLETRTLALLMEMQANHEVKQKELKIRKEEAAVKEDCLSSREKELNERDHELNAKLAKFKSMLTEFLIKKEKFEKEAAKLAEQNKITASKVELNVGGLRFTTSVSTLMKEEGSLFHMMFKGQHLVTPDADGSYFIDRDGTNFRHVLNFLRDGPPSLHHLPGHDLRLLSELRVESEHYQLHRMTDTLQAVMAERRPDGAFSSLPL